MRKLEFTIPLNIKEKEQALLFIRDLKTALAAVDESGKNLNRILKTKGDLDTRIAVLEAGDGSDAQAATELNTARTQIKQIERSIECAKSDHAKSVEFLGVEVRGGRNFIRSACESYLNSKLQAMWNEAVLPFFSGNPTDPKSLDFQFQMSDVKQALKEFFTFHDSDDLEVLEIYAGNVIENLETLIKGEIFWSFDRSQPKAETARERYLRYSQAHGVN